MSITTYASRPSLVDQSLFPLVRDLLENHSYFINLLQSAYYHKYKQVGKIVTQEVITETKYKIIIFIDASLNKEYLDNTGHVQQDALSFYLMCPYEPEHTQIEITNIIHDEFNIGFEKREV